MRDEIDNHKLIALLNEAYEAAPAEEERELRRWMRVHQRRLFGKDPWRDDVPTRASRRTAAPGGSVW